MSRPGGIPTLTLDTYVLTAAEVARLYFRRGPDFVRSEEFKRLHPTFPGPRNDGLYHRKSVEAWTDSTFGLVGGADEIARSKERELAMEIARRGPGPSAKQQAAQLRDVLSVDEVAEHMACNPATVRRLVRSGELPSFRVGTLIRIQRDELEKYQARIGNP